MKRKITMFHDREWWLRLGSVVIILIGWSGRASWGGDIWDDWLEWEEVVSHVRTGPVCPRQRGNECKGSKLARILERWHNWKKASVMGYGKPGERGRTRAWQVEARPSWRALLAMAMVMHFILPSSSRWRLSVPPSLSCREGWGREEPVLLVSLSYHE